ncbi:MAG: hypothetical protein DCC67_05760 [Planctomycetota bacterium]|nr:MAG: hypothetical protein DCC67_05760 [Planctomycetota bacterium]
MFAGLAVVALATVSSAPPLQAEAGFGAAWRAPEYESVRAQVLQWAQQAELPRSTTDAALANWPAQAPAEAGPDALLERLAGSFAVAYPEAAELVSRCSSAYGGPEAVDDSWLADPAVPVFVRHNLRLYYARWLAQFGLYDEVLDQLAGLAPADVVDPAALLFYQMAAYHQLVRPDQARAALVQLMEQERALPRRFQQVARLVERDLAALEDESLDHIARRMQDVRRRLDYGRAGSKVQEIENGVLESLDKKIEDLEKQQQQQQQGAAAQAGGSSQSMRPMDDSRPAELKAPMKVDQRDIGSQSGWGDLPPKEREQALQQIGRDFPAHYRELIEEYFRQLASEQGPDREPVPDATR